MSVWETVNTNIQQLNTWLVFVCLTYRRCSNSKAINSTSCLVVTIYQKKEEYTWPFGRCSWQQLIFVIWRIFLPIFHFRNLETLSGSWTIQVAPLTVKQRLFALRPMYWWLPVVPYGQEVVSYCSVKLSCMKKNDILCTITSAGY